MNGATDDLTLLGQLTGTGHFRVDEERNVVAVSPELERITGFTAEEVVGRSCLSLMRCEACLRRCGVFERGRVEAAQLTIFRKDGSEVQVMRSGVCERDETGAVTGAFETVRVVDPGQEGGPGDFPHALETLMNGLGRLFVVADGEFRIRAFSDRLPDVTGIPADALSQMDLAGLFGEDLFGPGTPLRQALARGERKEGRRADLPDGDGGRIPISLSAGPVEAPAGCGHPDVRIVVMMRRERDGEDVGRDADGFHGILGRSRAMQRIFRLIELVSESASTVLITGESGTGKELVARAIHDRSERAGKRFVAVNCAALPAELLESELFGHVRGAFTGAVRDRAGRFEMADGGTLFLDEIADLAPSLQAKILRVIQERTFERVGDARSRNVDVRVIAATHVDLEQAVADGRFRDDLYYRLRVIPIHIPPLRQRREDLPSLIRHLLEKIAHRRHRSLRLSPDASRALLAYDWLGNVRELENALEFAVTVCEGQTIHVRDLPDELLAARPQSPASRPGTPGGHPDRPANPVTPVRPFNPPTDDLSDHQAAEAARIQAALLQARYNRTRAAEALGISRTTLWRKMKEYRL